MPAIHIPEISQEAFDRLKVRARLRGRSFTAEMRKVLEESVGCTPPVDPKARKPYKFHDDEPLLEMPKRPGPRRP